MRIRILIGIFIIFSLFAGNAGANSLWSSKLSLSDIVSVDIVDFAFNKSVITVPVNTTVSWINFGNTTHTVTADDSSFDSGELQTNQSFSHLFNASGTFTYHCTFHTFMTGSVIVTEVITPAGILNLHALPGNTWINWSWIDPSDSNFSKVIVYLDNSFKENVSKGIQYYNATNLTQGTHTIATKTMDINGNINQTWANDTAATLSAPVITNARVEPNTSVNANNPAIAQAYVTGSNLKQVIFEVIDSSNLVDTNMTVLGAYFNESGLNGTYVSIPWYANAWSITNGTVQDIVTVILHASLPDYFFVFGSFKKNAAADEVNAILLFDKTTGNLLDIRTNDTFIPLPIENGTSSFKISKIKFIEGLNNPPRNVDGATFVLYSIGSQNNPHLISTSVPAGIYKALVYALDAMGNENAALTDIAVSNVVEGIRGDVNRNGKRDTGDATLILRNIVGLQIPSQYLPILPIGDMNCNGRIDTGDATLILRDVVGLTIPRCWE